MKNSLHIVRIFIRMATDPINNFSVKGFSFHRLNKVNAFAVGYLYITCMFLKQTILQNVYLCKPMVYNPPCCRGVKWIVNPWLAKMQNVQSD